jgi:hypothetical protein
MGTATRINTSDTFPNMLSSLPVKAKHFSVNKLKILTSVFAPNIFLLWAAALYPNADKRNNCSYQNDDQYNI